MFFFSLLENVCMTFHAGYYDDTSTISIHSRVDFIFERENLAKRQRREKRKKYPHAKIPTFTVISHSYILANFMTKHCLNVR